MTDTKYDPVNHPKHYTQYEHEVIELTEQLGFCLGNAVKYILRAPYKGNELEDLKKAGWYLNRLLAGDDKREYEPWSDDTRALAVTYKNPAIRVLFSYRKLCSAAIEATLARLDRMRFDAEMTCLKAQLDLVTEERDRLKAELSAERLKAHLGERSTPDFKGPYEVTMDADGKTMDIEHGC